MAKIFLKKTRNHKRGFSLVVALVMMALMLLIAISLVSFVVLETQISSYRIRRYQAQTNAISGLRIALAQLQMLTGDDQRVTATADILGNGGSQNPSLPSGTPYRGKKYWTGVWATGNLDKSDKTKLHDWDYAAPDNKPFLGWLVSNYDSESGRFEPYTLPVNKMTATTFDKSLVSKAISAYSVEDESNELITLVGAGTLGKKNGWEDNIVKVRRVPIEKITNYQHPPKTTGSFAYWVGDEGVKARINLPDNYDNKASSVDEWYKGFRSTPQRLAGEAIDTFGDLKEIWTQDLSNSLEVGATKLPYVVTIGDLAEYLDKTDAASLRDFRKYYHDISFYSKGVESDVYNGGLKTDLSLAFEMPWNAGENFEKGFRDYPQFHGSGDTNKMNLLSHFNVPNDNTTSWWLNQPTDGLGFVYEFDTKNNAELGHRSGQSKSIAILRGPTWDVFRNYYRFYKKEVETTGYRGFKPASDTSFTAMGIRPYTYVDGRESPNATSVSGSGKTYNGFFSLKGSVGTMALRGQQDTGQRLVTPMIDGDRIVIPQAMRIAPVILRFVFRFSLVFNQDTYALCMDPMMVLYNPYNVPIEFFGVGTFFTKYYPVSFNLVRTDGQQWPEFGYYDRQKTGLFKVSGDMPVDLYYYTNNVYMVRSHAFRFFAGTNSLDRAPSGTIRLQPGEIKAVFPASKERPKLSGMGTREVVASMGKTTFELSSVAGYALPFKNYIGHETSALTEDELENLRSATFRVDLRGSWGECDMYSFYLFYPKGSNDQNLTTVDALTRFWAATALGDDNDVGDESLIQSFSSHRLTLYPYARKNNFVGKTFSASGGSGWNASVIKQPIADINIYKAPASYTPLASPLLTNVRPWVCEPRNFNSANSNIINGTEVENFSTAGVGWVSEILPAKNEFSPIENVGGNAFWGDDISSSDGQTNVVLFEIPTQPMTSLGQFQSVDASWCEQETSYIVGNSYPPVGLDLSNRQSGVKALYDDTDITTKFRQPFADHSFAANLAIWDRYWFSTINFGDRDGQIKQINEFARNIIENKENCLPNKRVEFIRSRDKAKFAAEDIEKDFLDPNKVTRNFYYTGMFNVNSTSKEAWKAMLGSLHEQYLKIDGAFSEVQNYPIVRFANIIGSKLGGYVGGAGSQSQINDSFGDEGEVWRWYRSLDEKELDSLAEKIVDEVRERGPFMSLADFVNRRAYSANLEHARRGALQAAIDKTTLNNGNDIAESTPNVSEYKNLIPDNAKPSGRAGGPGYLSQGDILSCLGGGMSVRSDTFTIRAYGDVVGLDGNPVARAYCEAVVQRTPEWMEEQDDEMLYSPDKYSFDSLVFKRNYRNEKPDATHVFFEKFERNTNLKAVNRLLGRRYRVVSFRWLTPNEI
ncbi:MAG: pilus assembly PilX N-terminal domain-containing protein [Opitutales bacterium]|nr:pilus assembly PilX N-terminal domain-containing protein [Opitutales bacterium]